MHPGQWGPGQAGQWSGKPWRPDSRGVGRALVTGVGSGRAKKEGEVEGERLRGTDDLFLTLSWGVWLRGLWVPVAALALRSWIQQMIVCPLSGVGTLCAMCKAACVWCSVYSRCVPYRWYV